MHRAVSAGECRQDRKRRPGRGRVGPSHHHGAGGILICATWARLIAKLNRLACGCTTCVVAAVWRFLWRDRKVERARRRQEGAHGRGLVCAKSGTQEAGISTAMLWISGAPYEAGTGCWVFTPWRTFSRGFILPSMQIPDNFGNGVGAASDAVRGNETEEPLFGDPCWIDERLQALHGEPEREV